MTLRLKEHLLGGKYKVYEDPDAGKGALMGYKGDSYMGQPALKYQEPKEGELQEPVTQVTHPKVGDKFVVQDCMFGDVFEIKQGKTGLYGSSERGVITTLENDPKRGWIAVGYCYCPHVPPSLNPHDTETKRMGEDTREMVKQWQEKTDLLDGMNPGNQETIMTAALLENQRLMGHGTCGGWGV